METTINIQEIDLNDYQGADYNPRLDLKPGDADYEDINRSIDTFGYLAPIVVNRRTGHIISGHQRVKIFRAKGIIRIQAVVVDFDIVKEKFANLAMNKVGGDWDNKKLAVLLEEICKLPDFGQMETGFDLGEISKILDNYGETKNGDGFDFGAAVDEISEPLVKRGEVVTLGRHRLMCGDATNVEDLHTLLGEEKVDLLDIDWPYNVNYMGGSCPRVDTRPKKTRKWAQIYSDNLSQPEYEKFMRDVLTNVKPYLKPGAAFYQWQAHKQLGPLYQILTALDFHTSCLICWAKESAAISYADYSFQTEQAVYGFLKGESHYFAGKPGSSNLWQVKRDPTVAYIHPCQKPTALAERAISNSSKLNDVILDVFLGSGSVMIAAESLGRRCFGMELDEKFCTAIIRRYISFIGKDKISPELVQKYLGGK